MKRPRFTIGSVVFATLILAVHCAVIRAALFGRLSLEGWALPTLFLLPMIDALLVAAYRLRQRKQSSVRAGGFLLAGLVATATTLISACLAPEIVFSA